MQFLQEIMTFLLQLTFLQTKTILPFTDNIVVFRIFFSNLWWTSTFLVKVICNYAIKATTFSIYANILPQEMQFSSFNYCFIFGCLPIDGTLQINGPMFGCRKLFYFYAVMGKSLFWLLSWMFSKLDSYFCLLKCHINAACLYVCVFLWGTLAHQWNWL